MKIMRKILAFMLVLFLSTMIYVPVIYAHTMDDVWPDDDAGWTLYEPSHSHMGFIQTTYKFYDSAVEENYGENFNDGIELWGSLITITKILMGNMGAVDAEYNEGSNSTAYTHGQYHDPSTNHWTSWIITINSYRFDDKSAEGKARTIAHEIGHVYGLHHVPHNDTQHKKKCGLCKGYYLENHTWTDESDTICNDCGYMRPIAIVEVGGLLTVTLDGQSWVLNISGTGELQYNSSYSLPNGGTLIWNDVGEGNPYHRYCYNYNGIDYFYGDQYTSYTTQFADLREMTKVKRDEYSYYKLRYIRERPDQRYQFQWVQTTNNLIGGFYAQLFGNEVNGYYVKIYRVLLDGSGNKYHYAEVWSPSMNIPVYFSS